MSSSNGEEKEMKRLMAKARMSGWRGMSGGMALARLEAVMRSGVNNTSEMKWRVIEARKPCHRRARVVEEKRNMT